MDSVAHKHGMNHYGQHKWPSGEVPWRPESPPDQSKVGMRTGELRGCSYCGSMHPEDVAAAIRAGAHGSWADRKYGWPHKAYFDGVPNPHAGLLEVRGSSNAPQRGWEPGGDGHWYAPARPASATTRGKFYSVHLLDASPEDRALIEGHLGLAFTFDADGRVSWRPY